MGHAEGQRMEAKAEAILAAASVAEPHSGREQVGLPYPFRHRPKDLWKGPRCGRAARTVPASAHRLGLHYLVVRVSRAGHVSRVEMAPPTEIQMRSALQRIEV